MTSSQKLLQVTTLLGFALVCATVLWPSHALPENAPVTLPIETVANYLHAVIEAVVDRVVERGLDRRAYGLNLHRRGYRRIGE